MRRMPVMPRKAALCREDDEGAKDNDSKVDELAEEAVGSPLRKPTARSDRDGVIIGSARGLPLKSSGTPRWLEAARNGSRGPQRPLSR